MRNKKNLALKLTDVAFILLINVKMRTIMSRINFMQVEFRMKKSFITLRPVHEKFVLIPHV